MPCFGRCEETKEVAGKEVTITRCEVVGNNWQRVMLKNCGINCPFYKPDGMQDKGKMTTREFIPYSEEVEMKVNDMAIEVEDV